MYFIVTCMRLYVSRFYIVHTAVAWEMQVSAFSLANFEQYYTTLRMSFNE